MDERGVVLTDLVTFQNHLSGVLPQPDWKFSRLRGDGPIDLSRRYAPDVCPEDVVIAALHKLPQGFGRYANGLLAIYTAETLGKPSSGPGVLNGRRISRGLWARPGWRTVHLAVHEPASTLDGYSSGWRLLEWTYETRPWTGVGEEPDGIPESDGLSVLGRYGPSVFLGANHLRVNVASQRYGEHAFFTLDPGLASSAEAPTASFARSAFARSAATAADDPSGAAGRLFDYLKTLYHLTADLKVEELTLDSYIDAPVYVSDSLDPEVWLVPHGPRFEFVQPGDFDTVAQTRLSELRAGRTFPMLAASTSRVMAPQQRNVERGWDDNQGNGYENHVTSGSGLGRPAWQLLAPPTDRAYDPPDLWVLWPDVRKDEEQGVTFTAYRTPWREGVWARPYERGIDGPVFNNGDERFQDPAYVSGGTRFPTANPEGWGFDCNWRQPDNIVGRIPALPGYHDRFGAWQLQPNVEFRLFRDDDASALVMVIVSMDGGRAGVDPNDGYPMYWDEWARSRVIDSWLGALPETAPFDLQYSHAYRSGDTWKPGVPDPRPSQVWTTISFDEGATWSPPRQPDKPLRPRSGSLATQLAIVGGGVGLVDAMAYTFDGSLAHGFTDIAVHALPGRKSGAAMGEGVPLGAAGGPPIGGRRGFFTGPRDAGSRIGLHQLADLSRFGLATSRRDGIDYAKASNT